MDAPSLGIIGACSTVPLVVGYSGEALEELFRGTLKSFNRVTSDAPRNPHLLSTPATDPQ
jgi:hypothetical protein